MKCLQPMSQSITSSLCKLWFRDPFDGVVSIDDVLVRIRAGIPLPVPLFTGLMLYPVLNLPNRLPIVNTARDTYQKYSDGNINKFIQEL